MSNVFLCRENTKWDHIYVKKPPRVNRTNDPVEYQKTQLLSFQQFHLNLDVFKLKKHILLNSIHY